MKSYKKNSWFNNLYPAGLICLTTFFLFADQNLISPNLTLIAREFGFSDLERDKKLGGEIALGFFLIGGVISIIAVRSNKYSLFLKSKIHSVIK